MDIKHKNIVYISYISELGGVETYVHEVAKKYNYLDLAVIYKEADSKQLSRLSKLCPCYKHTNQKIICNVAVINFDVSIIDYINMKAKIYCGLHCDYKFCKKFDGTEPPIHKRIYKYIALTHYIAKTFKEITGFDNIIVRSNPLTIIKEQTLLLVSATRLSPIKGKYRMQELANALDTANINYIWIVLTNDTNKLTSPNVVFLEPKLDISCILDKADYLIQLSDSEG